MKTALLVPLLLFVFSYSYSQSSIEISELSVIEYLTSEKPEVKEAQSYFITSNGKSFAFLNLKEIGLPASTSSSIAVHGSSVLPQDWSIVLISNGESQVISNGNKIDLISDRSYKMAILDAEHHSVSEITIK
jgi:hypothetical protein